MMKSVFKIRPAIAADAATIVAFNDAMARETEGHAPDSETLRCGVEALLADADKGRYFLVEHEGRVVGQTMLTTEWSDWRNGEFWWIQSVYIEPEFRRRGVFRKLYRHVLQLAQTDEQCCGLRLYVERENEKAQQTYRALGMQPARYAMFEKAFTR